MSRSRAFLAINHLSFSTRLGSRFSDQAVSYLPYRCGPRLPNGRLRLGKRCRSYNANPFLACNACCPIDAALVVCTSWFRPIQALLFFHKCNRSMPRPHHSFPPHHRPFPSTTQHPACCLHETASPHSHCPPSTSPHQKPTPQPSSPFPPDTQFPWPVHQKPDFALPF